MEASSFVIAYEEDAKAFAPVNIEPITILSPTVFKLICSILLFMNNHPNSEEFYTYLTLFINSIIIYGLVIFSGFDEFIFSALASFIISVVLMLFLAPIFIFEAFLLKGFFSLFAKKEKLS